MKQRDLFDADPQRGLFDEDAAPQAVRADPDVVRQKLHRVLGEMRAASAMPFGPRDWQYWRIVAPQMSLWLPEAEAAQFRLDFAAEASRLNAA